MTIVSRLAKASERLAQEVEYFSHANGVGIACLNSLVKISAPQANLQGGTGKRLRTANRRPGGTARYPRTLIDAGLAQMG